MCQTVATRHNQAPQLVVVIMGVSSSGWLRVGMLIGQGRDTAAYQEIKNIAGQYPGMVCVGCPTLTTGMKLKMMFPTQCLLGEKITKERGLDQYCGNGEYDCGRAQLQLR